MSYILSATFNVSCTPWGPCASAKSRASHNLETGSFFPINNKASMKLVVLTLITTFFVAFIAACEANRVTRDIAEQPELTRVQLGAAKASNWSGKARCNSASQRSILAVRGGEYIMSACLSLLVPRSRMCKRAAASWLSYIKLDICVLPLIHMFCLLALIMQGLLTALLRMVLAQCTRTQMTALLAVQIARPLQLW
jgi:hypothetical protein